MKSGLIFYQKVTGKKMKFSRQLRKKMTDAEKALWKRLRNRQVAGLKFRRQQVIEGFIADFYCEELKLVIEVDGSIHQRREQIEYDAHRDQVFKNRGIKVIRFSNDMVMYRITEVLEEIEGLV
ncbi:MAG: endonuclease domain-containing protein [Chitinispirillaceae bacterium]|nr:endonuclease domain-containing protein [Chitinispirillaceae bacterium]